MSIRNTFSARVLPGVWDTRAIRWPTRAFSRLDLPTLERPMRASSGSGGSSGTSARGNDPTKSWRSMLRPGSGFLLLADALGHEQRGPTLRDAFGRHGDLADVIATRQLEHDVGHHLFQDGAQAARARAALDRLLGDGLERFLLHREPHVFELEQLLVLLREGVLRLDEDTDERVLVQRVERHHHRQPAHELGNEAVAQQVVGLDVGEGGALDLLHDAFLDLFLVDPDLPPPGAGLEDLLEPVERAAADEEEVPRVDLDEVEKGVVEKVKRNPFADVEPDDLLRYGLIPELVGRLPVVVPLDALDEDALIRILIEPKNALTKQYQKLFELEDVRLTVEKEALKAIAQKAIKRGTGARGLRAILEEMMTDIMFELPSRDDVREVAVTAECVSEGRPPLLVTERVRQKKEA